VSLLRWEVSNLVAPAERILILYVQATKQDLDDTVAIHPTSAEGKIEALAVR
jgi:hypothetical protein